MKQGKNRRKGNKRETVTKADPAQPPPPGR